MGILNKYNEKRDFKKTKEPFGKVCKSSQKLRFVVQHHLASHDHYDLRLEWKGVLKSFAIPKGPSFYPHDKRLAVLVEDHPYDYRNFEGIIPEGQYGGGTVMLWDEGFWEPISTFFDFDKRELKFRLYGRRLKGSWTLIPFKDKNWLFIKEKDAYVNSSKISKYNTSVRTGKSMREIETDVTVSEQEGFIEEVVISNSDKKIFSSPKVTKGDIVLYYQCVFERMFPFLEKRLISTIRCPDGKKFYKKHFESFSKGLERVYVRNSNGKKEDYYYIKNITGLIHEVQMNGYEFHIWGNNADKMSKPNMMVFDLDPDENLSLKKLRQGVMDLKSILDELGLVSFLKTSGGKGYHVVLPITSLKSWKSFEKFSFGIVELMVSRWPDKYTSSMSLDKRKGKIFIDWMRNKKGSTSVAPYSIRLRSKPTVSMPIFWDELDKIKPDEITIKKALNRLQKQDPWENFFLIWQ